MSAPGAPLSDTPPSAGERARRLLRWYPGSWRDRYGEEFAELLISDIDERPRSAARTWDVARGGLVARLALIGLAGSPLVPAAADRHYQVRASLGTLSVALATCLALAAGMWSQLMIGWGVSNGLARDLRPGARSPRLGEGKTPARLFQLAQALRTGRLSPSPTGAGLDSAASAAGRSATIVTSVTMLMLLALAVAAAVPVLATAARRLMTGGHRGLVLPAAIAVATGLVLLAGGRHFENNWAGTGGQDGLVPGGLAAFTWALTLWITSYWAHMGALTAFPLGERTWMVISPLALAITALAIALVIRRAGLSPRVLMLEARLATAACAVLAVLLASCCYWVVASGSAAGVVFHPGLVAAAATGGLALALVIAVQARAVAARGLRLARK